ncbi:MAG: DUF99 family protein [Candidatus Heimdallarchaeota archaeon]|nr:DUF99 family protein [Candidatus Heimdallarchaeota archaeon]
MNRNKSKSMKNLIRTIGIDDAAFQRNTSKETFVFGVIIRGHNLVEGILRTIVTVDGWDATDKIGVMISSSKYSDQLKGLILGSSTIAAFNIIDLKKLYELTEIPVITILPRLPIEDNIKTALSKLDDWEERFAVLKANPQFSEISYKNQIGEVCKKYFQQVGFNNIEEAKEVLRISTYSSSVPECLRLADLLGQSFKGYTIS